MDPPILDLLLEGNRAYVAHDWDPADRDLASPPGLKLAVVACMDTRHNVEKVLGLRHGDAKVVRNAGNLLDDGTLRSLVVAVHLLGVRRIAILGHTKCGMTLVGRGEFRIARSIAATTEVPLHEAMRPDFQRWLGGFADPEENVRRSAQLVRSHPLMPKGIEVLGLIYDNDTGRVHAVDVPASAAATSSVPSVSAGSTASAASAAAPARTDPGTPLASATPASAASSVPTSPGAPPTA